MSRQKSTQVHQLIIAALVTAVGLLVFKFIPMSIWGADILFDASMHIATAIFVLYLIWFFIDQNKNWRLPFFLFAAVVLTVISMQRLLDDAHNDIGLLLGLVIGLLSVGISRWKEIRKRLEF